MKKSIILLLLAIVMITSSVVLASSNVENDRDGGFENIKYVVPYDESTFDDISLGQWFEPYVKDAVRMNIIKGKGNNKFDPNGDLTLAEAVTLAAKLNKVYYGETPKFEAGGTNWYDSIVDYAQANGIIGEEFEGKYNNKATRAEMAGIFANSVPAEALAALNPKFSIPDVHGNIKYASQIQVLYDAGVLNGSDAQGSFNPSSNIKRSEAATIINKVAKPSIRTVREVPQDVVETPVDAPWEVGTTKVQISIDLKGNAVYRDVEIGATLISKGTLVAQGLRATEDFYVKHGSHTYGCTTQAEYDEVYRTIESVVKNIKFVDIVAYGTYDRFVLPYWDGTLNSKDKALLEKQSTSVQLELLKARNVEAYLKSTWVMTMEMELNALRNRQIERPGLSDESAYGALFGGQPECNGDAQMFMALYDILGYNSMVVGNNSHAWSVAYFDDITGTDKYYDGHFLDLRAGSVLVVKPTHSISKLDAGDYYNRRKDMTLIQGN